MRYKLDASGYVCAVSFGGYLDDCTEYTGAIPTGYNNLDDWATNACIQAYYIDTQGNLTLDLERQVECERKQAQDAIDNAPLLRKDLYESEEVFDMQYVRKAETGKVIALEDIKTIAPKVKITAVNPYEYGELSVYTQGKNMLHCIAKTEAISGVNFIRNINGSITVAGTATADIDYVIAQNDYLFSLKANEDYYLNLGGLNCELFYVEDGEIAQQYVGESGLINVPEHIKVSKVVAKIASGQIVKTTFFPQLEYGNAFTSYAEYKSKVLAINLRELIDMGLSPSKTLTPSKTLVPKKGTDIDYISIENGAITISVDGVAKLCASGSVGLFSSYSTIYADKDVMLEVEYSDNMMYVEDLEFLQGKATTTNKFKILKDGSIEAHNGYFSGRIEADSGYFKGEISWEQITGNEDVATHQYVEDLGYQNASQVTKITKDTVTTSFINALGLEVGKEIKMGSEASISWNNVTDQPRIPKDTGDLTNGAGYQTSSQVTTITKNTVTTEYINSLKVKAGSVDAENITGTTISGKVLKGVTGEFEGKITAKSGKIGGFDIGNSSIYSNTNSITSTQTGVYIGTDGLNLGGKKAVITSAGKATFTDIEINGSGSIDLGYSLAKMHLDYAGISFGASSTLTTQITSEQVKVHNAYMDKDGFRIKGTATYYTDIKQNLITFGSGSEAHIKQGNNDMIMFYGDKTTIISTVAVLGKSAGKVGFFGSEGSLKKTISTITTPSSSTAYNNATKINEIINALKAYNLIA
jgi:hypothetical protein